MESPISIAGEPGVAFADRRAKVWLECDGEPRDLRSVEVIEIRSIADDLELVVFACPRCGKRHQSLRFA
jgi:hypothetical protein